MGHHIQAFIGPRKSLEKIQDRFKESKVVDVQQGMALLPLFDQLYDAIPFSEDDHPVVPHFKFLSPKIIDLLVQYSEHDPTGYIETDYFGGAGDQGAVLAKEGKIIFGPQKGVDSINEVLKLMGIVKNGAFDEFEAIGLEYFRDMDKWLEQPDYPKSDLRLRG